MPVAAAPRLYAALPACQGRRALLGLRVYGRGRMQASSFAWVVAAQVAVNVRISL